MQALKVIILGMILALGIDFAFAAWTAPTAAPPGNNANAPLNVSSVAQNKAGALTLGGALIVNNSARVDGALYVGTEVDNNYKFHVFQDAISSASLKVNASVIAETSSVSNNSSNRLVSLLGEAKTNTYGSAASEAVGIMGSALTSDNQGTDSYVQRSYGVLGQIQTNDANDKGYAFYAQNNGTSDAGVHYGLYINLASANVTSYGIYQATNNPNYFTGNVESAGDVKGARLCIGTDCRSTWPSGGGSGVTGSGTSGNLSKWTGSSAIGDTDVEISNSTDYTNDYVTIGNAGEGWLKVRHILGKAKPGNAAGPLFLQYGNVGNVQIGGTTNTAPSKLSVHDGYAQFAYGGTSAPSSTDCDDSSEKGRLYLRVDTGSSVYRLYICIYDNSHGWDYMSLTN